MFKHDNAPVHKVWLVWKNFSGLHKALTSNLKENI